VKRRPVLCYGMAETPDPEVFDLRIRLRLRVSEVALRHRADPSGLGRHRACLEGSARECLPGNSSFRLRSC
jgi:hypothetical protein